MPSGRTRTFHPPSSAFLPPPPARQVCRGRVDHWVGPYLQLALSKLSTVKRRTLKVGSSGSDSNGLHAG